MSIIIVDNFQVNIKSPIDDRLVVGTDPILNMGETYSITYKNRDSIIYKYPGLRIWDFNESIPYVWNGIEWINENTSGALVETGGMGFANYITKFKMDGTVLTKSLLFDNNSNVGVGIYSGISPNSVQQWLPSETGDILVNSTLSTSLINRGIHVNGNIKTNNFFSGDGQYIINIHANNIKTGTLNLSRIAIPQSPVSGQTYVLTNLNGNTVWSTSETLTVTRTELGFINNGSTVTGEVSDNPDLNNPLIIASTVATKTLADRIVSVNNLLNTHTNNISNPHSVTKTQVGLGNIPNQTSFSNGSSDAITNNDSQVLATTALTYKLNQKIDTIVASDIPYASSWDGITDSAPSKNAVYDKIESMIVNNPNVSSWFGQFTSAPSMNALYEALKRSTPRYWGVVTQLDPGATGQAPNRFHYAGKRYDVANNIQTQFLNIGGNWTYIRVTGMVGYADKINYRVDSRWCVDSSGPQGYSKVPDETNAGSRTVIFKSSASSFDSFVGDSGHAYGYWMWEYAIYDNFDLVQLG